MNEEEFRAKLGQAVSQNAGAAPPVAPVYKAAAAPTAPAFRAPAPAAPARTNTAGANARRGAFRSGVKLPLTVRQSQKDGRFYLSGFMSFTIDLDDQAIAFIKETGQGLNDIKVGEVTVWPPFIKGNRNTNGNGNNG